MGGQGEIVTRVFTLRDFGAPAPMASDQRGPDCLATQPKMGAPMVIPPRATPTRRAITLPRMDDSVESCIMLLVPAVRVSRARDHESSCKPPIPWREP